MKRVLKVLFFGGLVRFLVLWVIGLRIRHRHRLPRSGPAIVVANHNSHLDTLVLMSLFPLSMLHRLRPLADEQYFLHQNRGLAWFSQQVMDIIPVAREGDLSSCAAHRAMLTRCTTALADRQILILYPEGSRGEPERLADFKGGVAHLAKLHPQVPIYPVFLHGLGKALPKGEVMLVPFFCDVFIGEPLYWTGKKQAFVQQLMASIEALAAEETLAV